MKIRAIVGKTRIIPADSIGAVMTGYFGIPGRTGGKTHIVVGKGVNHEPICGHQHCPKSKFQWTSSGADPNVECKTCKKVLTTAIKQAKLEP